MEKFYTSSEMPEGLRRILPNDGRKLLLVCMNGSTSLRLAQLLAKSGIEAESLTGGIVSLSATGVKQTSELVEIARE